MERFSRYGILIAHVMISMVFLLNVLGIIDQNMPAREMMERGAPCAPVPTQSQPALSRSIYAKVRNGAVLTTPRRPQP